MSFTGGLPANSQVVGATPGGTTQAFRPGAGGRLRAGASLTGVFAGTGVLLGCGAGVLVGAAVGVAVGTGVSVAGGSSSSSARLTVAGVGRINAMVSATATSRRPMVLDEFSSIMRTGAECCRWQRWRASPSSAL